MKKNIRKLIPIILIIGLLFSACGEKAAETTGRTTDANTEENTSVAAATTTGDDSEENTSDVSKTVSDSSADFDTGGLVLPISDGSVTLTLFLTTRLGVDNYEENSFTQWTEEQTGINLDFVVAPEQSVEEKLNVLLAYGDYPDVITGNRSTPLSQLKLYGDQGIFIPLNDLIEEHGVNIKRLLEEYPESLSVMETPDGIIYGLPDVNDCYHCQMDSKMWIYQPWLDTLGLTVPETTEEFRDMLIAFRDQDPNGNGEADEIPMMGANNGGWNAFPELFLMNSFTYYSNQYAEGLYIKDGKITAAYTEDEWKEGLLYLHDLVKEGLLAPETYTQDNSVLVQNVDNPDPLVGAVPSGYMGMFTQIGPSDRWKDYVAISPVAGPEGVRYSKWNPYASVNIKYIITDNCKNPVEAFLLADFFLTEEASFRSVQGEPGVGWQYIDENSGLLGINGEPARYEVLLGVDNMPVNTTWNQSTIAFRSAEFRLSGALSTDAEFERPLHYMTEENYAPYQPSTDMPIPPLYFTEDQANELLTIETTLRSYIKEKNAAFITGAQDIEASWSSYLQELEGMGLTELIAIYQSALDGE